MYALSLQTPNCVICKKPLKNGKDYFHSGHVFAKESESFVPDITILAGVHTDCLPEKNPCVSGKNKLNFDDREGCWGFWEPEMGVEISNAFEI